MNKLENISWDLQLTSEDINDLTNIVKAMFERFPIHRIFTLEGDLGAGKTTFVQHIGTYLNIKDEISSPTFSLINEYEDSSGQAVFHMDLYRIEDIDELYNIGFEEYLDQNQYTFIEWPQIAVPLYSNYVRILIELLPNSKRRFNFVEIQT